MAFCSLSKNIITLKRYLAGRGIGAIYK